MIKSAAMSRHLAASPSKAFRSTLWPFGGVRGAEKPVLEFVQRGCKLCELMVLSRRAISALVNTVGSNYDFAAEVDELKDRSRKAQSAYRNHRGGRSMLVVSGSVSQER